MTIRERARLEVEDAAQAGPRGRNGAAGVVLLRCHSSVPTSTQITAHRGLVSSSLGSLHSAVTLSANRHCWKFSFLLTYPPHPKPASPLVMGRPLSLGKKTQRRKIFCLGRKCNAQGDNLTEREGVQKQTMSQH